jgi:hypothetical protein
VAFTQEQALALADRGADAVHAILTDPNATPDQLGVAQRARAILATRAELEMDRRMAGYDNA